MIWPDSHQRQYIDSLVGAGGIGIELKVAMDLFQYDTAAVIILMIFCLVVTVEQVSNRLRVAIIGAQ